MCFLCKAAIAGLFGRESSEIAPSSGSRSLGLLNQLSFNAISVTANSIPHILLFVTERERSSSWSVEVPFTSRIPTGAQVDGQSIWP